MPFKITARTIIQLGGELISSDGVAFYELIKNAIDAKSKRIDIAVFQSIPFDVAIQVAADIVMLQNSGKKVPKSQLNELRETILENWVKHTRSKPLLAKIESAKDISQLLQALRLANFIEFADVGQGMSTKHLEDVFQTVGTPFRLLQQQSNTSEAPLLGEKGLGRLSSIRLGDFMTVKTTQTGESKWHVQEIDWSEFRNDPSRLLQDVPIPSVIQIDKEAAQQQGTVIKIANLHDDWSEQKLEEIAVIDLCKFRDPFESKSRFTISLTFNDRAIPIPQIDKLLFEHSHAFAKASLAFNSKGTPILRGEISYHRFGRQTTFEAKDIDVLKAAKVKNPDLLKRLGPFTVSLHWFNRLYATAIDGIGTQKQVRDLIRQWAGGLMVFRDGFRVHPYGGAEDDWLDLDKEAFRSGGYKLNRQQIIGKVDISRRLNPALMDQTNREGLCDCIEKQVLKSLLQHVLRKRFKTFLEKTEGEHQKQNVVTFGDLRDRFGNQRESIQQTVKELKRLTRTHQDLKPIVARFEQAIGEIDDALRDAEVVHESLEEKRTRFLKLAGVGLMVEILAHELQRSVFASMSALTDAISEIDDPSLSNALKSSRVQMKSLEKRLRILDRLSTSGRQRKEVFDPAAAVKEIFSGRKAQFDRHNIKATVVSKGNSTCRVEYVKGMFYQIIENLTENAVYWLREQATIDPSANMSIIVTVDPKSRQLQFTDTGTGIARSDAEQVFLPFYSLKPEDEGKGLGLYICREIAEYHGGNISLVEDDIGKDQRLRTFSLDLPKPSK
ncbi:Sensor protein SrrB [Gimesia maris]|uniref:sensor histidine kinase n=1 Tax=Gimesia maris TaxID=122 RepID=UPI00118C43E8|nr:HAMP domain-containing sensor histidine kinase [Gimesia maris]QDT78661.1 Sensor protein SrrB [Gimesia maris]